MTASAGELRGLIGPQQAEALARWIVRDYLRDPSHPHWDDAMGDARLGLAQAINAYDPSRGALFASFAAWRMRGAVLDGIRAWSPLSRRDARGVSLIQEARAGLEQILHRAPTDAELAEVTGWTPEAVATMEDRAAAVVTLSLDHETEDGQRIADTIPDERPLADVAVSHMNRSRLLHAAIAALPEQERCVMERSARGVTLQDIAADLGVSASRVSQVHSHAIERLKRRLAAGGPTKMSAAPSKKPTAGAAVPKTDNADARKKRMEKAYLDGASVKDIAKAEGLAPLYCYKILDVKKLKKRAARTAASTPAVTPPPPALRAPDPALPAAPVVVASVPPPAAPEPVPAVVTPLPPAVPTDSALTVALQLLRAQRDRYAAAVRALEELEAHGDLK